MLSNILINYETNKLIINNVNTVNLLVILIYLITFIVTLRKSSTSFIDKVQTDQLKGFAILLILIAHVWIHVSKVKSNLIFDEVVALFFILSGFGLTLSSHYKSRGLKKFFQRRITRIMVPYWVATLLLLSLDYLILNKTYSFIDLSLTFLGLNINNTTRHIDYARWYITLLLIWYLLFYYANNMADKKKKIIFLFSCATGIFFIDYYITHYHLYQIYAFPVGCIIGLNITRIKELYENHATAFIVLSVVCISMVLGYKISLFPYLVSALPSIGVKLINEFTSIILSIGMIYIVASIGSQGYYSKVFAFIGSISLELFLLHGAFLIKYDAIIFSSSIMWLTMQFMVFLSLIIAVSYLFKKGTSAISKFI